MDLARKIKPDLSFSPMSLSCCHTPVSKKPGLSFHHCTLLNVTASRVFLVGVSAKICVPNAEGFLSKSQVCFQASGSHLKYLNYSLCLIIVIKSTQSDDSHNLTRLLSPPIQVVITPRAQLSADYFHSRHN